MIIKSLLFIIVLIFAYETLNKLYKLQEEYFSVNTSPSHPDSFISLSNPSNSNPELDDIAKTIAINCKSYSKNRQANKIMAYKPPMPEELDTPYYAQYKPLEYNPKRLYFYRRDILIPEGKRRNRDDETEIQAVQSKYDKETDIAKKEILQDELDLFKWRDSIAKLNDTQDEPRNMRDITTDYFPEEIGQSRIWREPHSHIPNYSKALNNGYNPYGFDKYNEKDVKESEEFKKIKNKLCLPYFYISDKCKVKASNADTLLKPENIAF